MLEPMVGASLKNIKRTLDNEPISIYRQYKVMSFKGQNYHQDT